MNSYETNLSIFFLLLLRNAVRLQICPVQLSFRVLYLIGNLSEHFVYVRMTQFVWYDLDFGFMSQLYNGYLMMIMTREKGHVYYF